MKQVLLAALAATVLVACAEEKERDYTKDFPNTPLDVAAAIVGMDCNELGIAEFVLSQIDTLGPLARAAIRASALPSEDKDAFTKLIDASSAQKDDAQGLINLMQTVKFCG